MERCPGCRGRLNAEPACPRCGCELGLVRRAEAQAQQRLAQALQAWAQGDAQQARAQVQAALRLVHSPLARRVQLMLRLG